MTWKETTSMTLRTEFIALAQSHGVSVSELARRFRISRKTAYKWFARADADEPLTDQSRRPRTSRTQWRRPWSIGVARDDRQPGGLDFVAHISSNGVDTGRFRPL